MNLVYICGRQGMSLVPFLSTLENIDKLKVYMSPKAYDEYVQSNGSAPFLHRVPDDEKWEQELIDFQADAILVVTYLKLLPIGISRFAKYGMVNIHPSFLPRYRGLSPVFYALRNGETETGITYHFISEGIDAGDIIWQKRIKILETDCASSLWLKINRTIMKDLPGFLSEAEHWADRARPQSEEEATHCGMPTALEQTVDFFQDRTTIRNTVRACGRLRGATVNLCGHAMQICQVQEVDPAPELAGLPIGRVAVAGEKLLAHAQDGWLQLTSFLWDGNRYDNTGPDDLTDLICQHFNGKG